MGRAIVREPPAFLMDEPLSNLDAKLRVQMRAEIAKLQRDLGVTTIYVTHDQVEAMTMGDRVAVMRKGELQQVDDPQTLYDRPVNLFVGGFIGSPAMNMLDATIEQSNGELRREDRRADARARRRDARARGPALQAYEGKPRGPRHPARGPRGRGARDRRARRPRGCRARLELREALGSEIMAHFAIEARARRDRRDARAGARTPAAEDGAADRRPATNEAVVVGRFGARSRVADGRGGRRPSSTRARCTSSIPRQGIGIYDACHHERSTIVKEPLANRSAAGRSLSQRSRARVAAHAAHRERLEDRAGADRRQSRARSRSTASGPAPRPKAFGAVIKAFNKIYPNVKVNYKPVGDNMPTVLATAVAGGNPPDMAGHRPAGLVKQFAEAGPAEADRRTRSRRSRRTSRRRGRSSGRSTASCTALVFKAANKSMVWYNVPAFKTAGVEGAEDVGASCIAAAKTLKASGTPAYSIGGADGWTLTDLFENIYLRTCGAGEVRRPVARTRSSGPTRR